MTAYLDAPFFLLVPKPSIRPTLLNSAAGECLFAFFTPPRTGRHRPYVCGALVAVLALLYFFMAGQYGAPAMQAQRDMNRAVWMMVLG